MLKEGRSFFREKMWMLGYGFCLGCGRMLFKLLCLVANKYQLEVNLSNGMS